MNKFKLIEEAAKFETSQLKRDELIYFVESVKMYEMMELDYEALVTRINRTAKHLVDVTQFFDKGE
jgi:predicted ferric reductase